LQTEIDPTSSDPSPLNLQVSVEVRRSRVMNVDMGYEFRNVRARVLGADPTLRFRIQGVKLVKNTLDQTDFTFFENINIVMSGAADTLLQNGGNWATLWGTPVNTDKIGLRFTNLVMTTDEVTPPGGGGSVPGGGPGVTIPTRVSFAELNSNDQLTGVFRRYCMNCHNAGNRLGGLDITNYMEANTLSGSILSRMQNAANPMPPAGVLDGIPQEIVRVWINSGKPQN
jgi:hypothetical protein